MLVDVSPPRRFAPCLDVLPPGRFAPGRFALWTIQPMHVDVSSLNFRSWAFRPLDVDVQMDVCRT